MDREQVNELANAYQGQDDIDLNETLYFKKEAALLDMGKRIEAITGYDDHENPNIRVFTHDYPMNEDGHQFSLAIEAHYNHVTGSFPRTATEIKATWRSNGRLVRIEDTSVCQNRAEEVVMFNTLELSLAEAEAAHAETQAADYALSKIPKSFFRNTA